MKQTENLKRKGYAAGAGHKADNRSGSRAGSKTDINTGIAARAFALLLAALLFAASFPMLNGELYSAAESNGTSGIPDAAASASASTAPGAIRTLSISTDVRQNVRLQWSEAEGDFDGYKVYRDGRAIAKVVKDCCSFTDKNAGYGTTNTYRVRAYKNNGSSVTYGAASPDYAITDGYIWTAGSDGAVITGYNGRSSRVVIPETIGGAAVTAIGAEAFRGNVWIEKVLIPEGVTEIGDYAFEACNALRKVSFPSTLQTVGDGAFNDCSSLRAAEMDDNVRTIGRGAFLYCSSIKTLTLPKDLESLGEFAFAGCSSLLSAEFTGTSLKQLPDRAFCSCSSLINITLPDGLVSIGKRAFSGCENLGVSPGTSTGYLNLPDSVESIGDYAFENCTRLRSISKQSGKLNFGYGVFSGLADGEALENLQPLTLPQGSIFNEGTFYGSRFNGIVFWNAELPKNKMINGSLYSKDGGTLIAYFPMKEDEYGQLVTVGDGVTFTAASGTKKIAPYAFYNAALQKVVLPNSVTKIASHAFSNTGLRRSDVTIPKNCDVAADAFDPEEPDQEQEQDQDDSDDSDDSGDLSENAYTDDSGDSDESGDTPEDADTVDESEETLIQASVSTSTASTAENVLHAAATSESSSTSTQYKYESLAGSKSIYRASDFKGYIDFHDKYETWVKKYIEYNKDTMPMDMELMQYIGMYKGDAHYNQMVSALNHEESWTKVSIDMSGDDYAEMYLMIDHGLCAELGRGRVPDDIILYSGVTNERVSDYAGVPRTETPSVQQLIDSIGKERYDEAMTSTSADPGIAFGFSDSEDASGTLIIIYASADALDVLGTICIDKSAASEEELLFNAGARYKMMDVGTMTRYSSETGNNADSDGDTEQRTYIRMQLLGGEAGTYTLIDEPEPADPDDPADPAHQMGEDGTPFGRGASEAAMDAAASALSSDSDPAGTHFRLLRPYATAQTKTSLKLKWKQPAGAVKYVIYGAKSGKSKMTRITETTASTLIIKKIAGSKLKKGTYYKFMIAAIDSSGSIVSTSTLVHAATKGGRHGNPAGISTAASSHKNKITIKIGKKFRLKTKVTGRRVTKHAAVRYESSNAAVATVSKKGVIKASAKGNCKIYAYAQNGLCRTISVKVK